MLWKKHQLIWIEADHSLGPAMIEDDSDASFFSVRFLQSGETRNYTKKNPPFKRVSLHVGQKIKLRRYEREFCLTKVELKKDHYVLECEEGVFEESDVVEISTGLGILDLLKQKKFTSLGAYQLRKKAWELLKIRNQHPLCGAYGCRVQVMPHQLSVVSSALKMPVVRALLADEVGLGKTIEAGLIFSALHARHKLKRVLVLVPPALKVQWLTENFRRFNVKFRLDHESMIEEDEFRDFVIASLDEIAQNISEFDLLIVDEAHRLVHDSENADVLARLVKVSKHVLFLSATPRVHGDLEFLKMIQILGSTTQDFIEPSVFQSKRSELGLAHFRQLEAVIVSDKFEWLLNFLRKMIATTPKEKVFLIGSQAADIIALTRQLREKLGEHFAIFHEDMTLVERDKQAAYFSDLDGAQFLVSSEIGGEGRNFQFCHHLVLLDIPKDPLIVEQRIGRLDRIGQTQKVRVWCPVLEEDPEESAFEILRDKYKVFEKAWSGAGLADLKESDLMDIQNKKQDLEQLQKKGKFNKINFNKEEAATLVNSLNTFGSIDIREFLDSLYDLFGIEVEDFDTRGNWRVFSSSLMFVDYFPGLGESGERVLTFDRSQALAREDMTFFTLDHPDFIECLEFLINSEEGRLALATLPLVEKTDLFFESLQKVEGRQEVTTQAWSYAQKKEVILEAKQIQKAQALKPEMLPDAFMNSLPVALQGFLTKAEEVDALLVLIQARLN